MAVKVQPEVAYGKEWWPSLTALQPVEMARVATAVQQFIDNPDHNSLNLHPLNGDKTRRLHTIRASQELRVLLAKTGNVYILLEAGHHDAVYERADRLQFISNPHTGFIGVATASLGSEAQAAGGVPRSSSTPAVHEGPRPLDHWTDAELGEAGCSAADIAAIRACVDDAQICDLPSALFELVIEILDKTPAQWRTPAMDPVAEAEQRLRTMIEEYGALAGFTPLLGAEEAKALAAAPIEDWMVFLHPDQRSVVRRRYDGPARVRGSAGTGKTVVGLHRAAELANRYADEGGRILFTTFINSLPPVFENLFERIPGAQTGAVDFVNVDKLASDLCRTAGRRVTVEAKAVEAAWSSAWAKAADASKVLTKAKLSRDYVREEITSVIKGRGIDSLSAYRELDRTGRKARLSGTVRDAIWAVREEWDRQMDLRGTVDFADRLLEALVVAQSTEQATYRCAVIDEAQDITLVGLQLVRALVNGAAGADRPDGLLIVGDGAQRIYPGGFSLRQAGVEVRGRTTVLKTNYRNTREVIKAAMAVAGNEPVDDLGEEYRRADEQGASARSGAMPALVASSGPDSEVSFIATRIDQLVESELLDYGDLAVAVPTNRQAEDVVAALKAAGLPVQPLEKYTGVPTPAVKVGTHHRIKGLEFKVVFLPFLGRDDFPRPKRSGQADDEYEEQCERSLSQLFVAMTRARDQLYVLASGDPTESVARALNFFDLMGADDGM